MCPGTSSTRKKWSKAIKCVSVVLNLSCGHGWVHTLLMAYLCTGKATQGSVSKCPIDFVYHGPTIKPVTVRVTTNVPPHGQDSQTQVCSIKMIGSWYSYSICHFCSVCSIRAKINWHAISYSTVQHKVWQESGEPLSKAGACHCTMPAIFIFWTAYLPCEQLGLLLELVRPVVCSLYWCVASP